MSTSSTSRWVTLWWKQCDRSRPHGAHVMTAWRACPGISAHSRQTPGDRCPAVGTGAHAFASPQMFGNQPGPDRCIQCGRARNG